MSSEISKQDLTEILDKSKLDGSKLYATADSLHRISQLIIITIGAIGVVSGVSFMGQNSLGGFIIIVLALTICAIMHLIQTVITNSTKVLVHILFVNIAVLRGVKNEPL